MKNALISILPLVLIILCSCAKSPDISGAWKNKDGNIMIFSSDSSVLLKQEGMEGGDRGKYSIHGDTIRIITEPVVDENGHMHNEFVLQMREDHLHFLFIRLIRSEDTRTVTGDQLAQRLGKTREQMAFSRVEGL